MEMGFMRSCFTLMVEPATGIYIAQNYDVSNVKKMVNIGMAMAKAYKQNYRKSKKGDDNSD